MPDQYRITKPSKIKRQSSGRGRKMWSRADILVARSLSIFHAIAPRHSPTNLFFPRAAAELSAVMTVLSLSLFRYLSGSPPAEVESSEEFMEQILCMLPFIDPKSKFEGSKKLAKRARTDVLRPRRRRIGRSCAALFLRPSRTLACLPRGKFLFFAKTNKKRTKRE